MDRMKDTLDKIAKRRMSASAPAAPASASAPKTSRATPPRATNGPSRERAGAASAKQPAPSALRPAAPAALRSAPPAQRQPAPTAPRTPRRTTSGPAPVASTKRQPAAAAAAAAKQTIGSASLRILPEAETKPTRRAPQPPDARPSPAAQPLADVVDMDRILEMPARSRQTAQTAQTRSTPATRSSRPAAPAPVRAPQPQVFQRPQLVAQPAEIGGGGAYSRSMPAMRTRPQLVARGADGMEPIGAELKQYMAILSERRKRLAQSGEAAPMQKAPSVEAEVCPRCGGAGFLRLDVPVGHPDFGQVVPCECKKREMKAHERDEEMQRVDFYRQSLAQVADKTFETFNSTPPGIREAYDVALAYARAFEFTNSSADRLPDYWLMFIGDFGVGKTHLAAAIADRCISNGHSVYFAVVEDLLDHLRATFAPTSEITYDKLFDQLRGVDLLVLDDLGAKQTSPWATEKLFQILNYRYNLRFPTIITTNNQLHSHLDARIRSRLNDASLVRIVNIKAQDHRPRNTKRAPRW